MKMNLSDKTQFCAKSFTPIRVSSKLIRGQSVSNPITIYNMKKQGVNQIIDLRNLSTEKTQIIPIFFERLFCKIFKIKYINTKYSHKLEGMPSNSFFNNINNLILNNSEQTYIHCRHGKRRTGVCVAVFEMFHTDKNKSERSEEHTSELQSRE